MSTWKYCEWFRLQFRCSSVRSLDGNCEKSLISYSVLVLCSVVMKIWPLSPLIRFDCIVMDWLLLHNTAFREFIMKIFVNQNIKGRLTATLPRKMANTFPSLVSSWWVGNAGNEFKCSLLLFIRVVKEWEDHLEEGIFPASHSLMVMRRINKGKSQGERAWKGVYSNL